MTYTRQIYVANETVIQGQKPNYIDALTQVGLKNDDSSVKELWLLIQHLLLDLPKTELLCVRQT